MLKKIQMLNSRTLLLTPVLALALSACQNSGGGNTAVAIDPNSVAGTWQVDGIMKNGTKTETDQGGTPNDEGYSVKANTLQFKITPTHFTTIHSDGVTADVLVDSDYTVNGNQLLLKGTPSDSGSKVFAVMSVDSSSMVIQPANTGTSTKDVYHLKRIDESQLATLALSPIQQTLDYSISGSAPGDLGSASFKSIPANSIDNQGHILACQYQKSASPSFSINLVVAHKSEDGTYAYNTKDENLMIGTNVAFDFTKNAESLDIKIGGGEKSSVLSGIHVSADGQGTAKSTALALPDGGDAANACSLHLDRADRDIKFVLNCPKVTAGSTNGKLDATGDCLLMFSDFTKIPKGKSK